MTRMTVLSCLSTFLFAGCTSEEEAPPQAPPAADAHEHGPHGGHMLELGDHVAHLEVVHDDAAGRMTLYLFGADAKTPMPIAKPPELKLTTTAGPKVLVSRPESGTAGESNAFVVVDDLLKGGEPEGRVSVEIGGRQYNPDLAHDHH